MWMTPPDDTFIPNNVWADGCEMDIAVLYSFYLYFFFLFYVNVKLQLLSGDVAGG